MQQVDFANIILRTVGVYAVVIILFRLFGKKHTTSISISDVILIVLIGGAVKDAMTGGDETWVGGALSGVTLVVVNYFVDFFMYKSNKLRKTIEGEPVILVHNGRFVNNNMKKVLMSEDEFHVKMRHHEIEKLEEIKYAVLEVDGSVSFIRKDNGS